MKASIHSRDDYDNRASSGKTFRVSSATLRIRCAKGALTLTAKESESYGGSSERSPNPVTMPRDVTRTFELELSPREVKRIIDAAVRNGLLGVNAEFVIVDKRPKSKRTKG